MILRHQKGIRFMREPAECGPCVVLSHDDDAKPWVDRRLWANGCQLTLCVSISVEADSLVDIPCIITATATPTRRKPYMIAWLNLMDYLKAVDLFSLLPQGHFFTGLFIFILRSLTMSLITSTDGAYLDVPIVLYDEHLSRDLVQRVRDYLSSRRNQRGNTWRWCLKMFCLRPL